MSGSVWDKYKIPQDPSGNIPETDAVLPQRKPDDLPPAAQEKAEAEGRREAADKGLPKPVEVKPSGAPKYEKKVYTGGTDFKLERPDGTPIDVDLPKSPALIEDPDRPVRVYKAKEGQAIPYGSPAVADRLTESQRDIRDTAVPTPGVYGSPAIAEREARLADEKAAKAAEAERKAQAEKPKAAKPASPAASPTLADKASEPSTGWRESPASLRMKEEKYYPSPAQLTGFAVREAREKLTGKPLDVDGLMKRLEDVHRSFGYQLTYASPTTAHDVYARRKKAVEDAIATHATAVGSTNRRALEMEAASRGIPLASMIEQYETDDKSTPRANDIVEATKRRGVDLERLNHLDDIDINWASFSPQIFTSASTTGVLGNDETDKDVEIVKPGELGYEAALMVLNAVEEDGYNVGYITRLANERGGAQRWVEQRTADLTAGLTSADPQYDEKMGRAYQRAIAEIAAFKTVGLWASPIFMNDLIAPDYSKGLGERLWDAVKNQQEVIGYGPTSDPNKPRIITRARSAPATFFDAIDIPQQATAGFAEEIAKKGWDQADFAEGAIKGIEDKRDFMQAAVQSDWAKPTQVYDAFGQLKLDADGNPVMEGEWKPLVAGGLGFAASVLFPDMTLYAGKAVGVGTDVYKGLRDGRRLAEATNLVDSVIALRAEGAATLRHAEAMNKKFRDAIASGASAAEVDKWRLAASDSRQLARAAFDEAAVQEAKLRTKYKMVAEDVDRMDAGVAADLAKDNPDIFNTRLAQAASQSDELLTLHPSMRRMKTKAPVVSDMRAKQPTELSTVDYEDLFNTSRIIGSIDQTLGETPSAEAVARVLRTTASNDVADIRRVIGDDDVAVQLLNDIEDTLPQAVADPKAWSRAILDRRNDLPSINPPDDAADAVKEAAKEKRKRLVRAVVNIYSKAKAAAKDASTDIRGRAIDAALTNNESRITAASIMSERLRAMKGSKKSQLKNVQPDPTIDMALEKADYDASLTDGGLAFKKMLIEAGLPEKEAQVAAVITDARARVASWKRGISTDEWYATRIEGVVKGDASKFTADTLYQESLAKNTDLSRLAVPEGFFSPLQRAIAKVIGDNNGRPVKSGYLLQQVKKQSGVKADELQWSGLEEFLVGKEKVSLEEVTEWLTTREPVVEVKGVSPAASATPEAVREAADRLARADAALSEANAKAREFLEKNNIRVSYTNNSVAEKAAEVLNYVDQKLAGELPRDLDAQAWKQYEKTAMWLETHGVRATNGVLPKPDYVPDAIRAEYAPAYYRWVDLEYGQKTYFDYETEVAGEKVAKNPALIQELRSLVNEVAAYAVDEQKAAADAYYRIEGRESSATVFNRYVAPGPSENYREIRFVQPAIPSAGGSVYQHFEPNAIAHMRVTDRVAEDGKKVLFVEEVQSDWHQAGAKEGYLNTQKADAEAAVARQRLNQIAPTTAEAKKWADGLIDNAQTRIADFIRYTNDAEVANAVATWNKSGVEAGASPEYTKAVMDYVMATARANAPRMAKPNAINAGAHAETWRELALKQALIIAAREGYDGVAMTRGPIIARVAGGSGVGGELPGQLAFYEEILPNTAASLAKKNGSRLETTRLNVGAVVDDEKVKELRSIYARLKQLEPEDIDTPEGLRDRVLKKNTPEVDAEIESLKTRAAELTGGRFETAQNEWGGTYTKEVPGAWTKTDGGVSNVPYIPVTDAMKAKVESEGLPLFSRDTINTPAFKKWFGDSKVVDAEGRPLVVYHGSSAPRFDAFEIKKKSDGEYPGLVGDAAYFSTSPKRAAVWGTTFPGSYRRGVDEVPFGHMQAVYAKVERPLFAEAFDSGGPRVVAHKNSHEPPDDFMDALSAQLRKQDEAYAKANGIDNYRGQGYYFDVQRADPAYVNKWNLVFSIEGDTSAISDAAKQAGYDGFVIQHYTAYDRTGKDIPFEKGDIEVAVFSPEQVKSVHNSGAFNPHDPRLLYSKDTATFSRRNPFSVIDVDKVVSAVEDGLSTTAHAQDFADDFTSVLNKAVKTRDEGIVDSIAEALDTGRYTGKEPISRAADVFYGALDSKAKRVLSEMVDRARTLIGKVESKTNASLDSARGWKPGGVDELVKAKTAKEAARVVAKHAEDESLRVIAAKLVDNIADDEAFSVADKLEGTAHGVRRYASTTNDVFKRGEVALAKGDSLLHMRAETVVHELLHSATANQLLRYKTMVQQGATVGLSPEAVRACEQLNAQYAHVTSYVRNNPKEFTSSKVPYGLKNVDEFVAEAFSNPRFRELLKKVPSIGHSDRLRSIYDDFIAALRSLFGISNVPASALDDVLEAATDLATTASAEIGKLRSVDRGSIEKQLDDIQKANLEFARVAYADSPMMLRDAKFLFTRDSYRNTALYSKDASTAARLLEANTAVRSLTAELGASRKTLADAQSIASAYPNVEVYAMERVEESRISAKTGDIVRTSHWRVVENPGRMSPRAFMLKDKGSDNAWLVPNAVRLERLSDDFDFSALKNKAPTAQYGSVSAPASGKYDATAREYKTEKVGSLSDDARSSSVVAPSAPKKETERAVNDSRSVEETTPVVAQPSSRTEYKRIEPPKAVWVPPPPWGETRYPVATASDGLSLSLGQAADRMRETTTSATAAPTKPVTEKVNISVAAGLIEANQRAADAKAEVDRLTDALDKTKKRADTVRKAIDATKKSKISPDRLRDSVVKLRAEAVALKSDIETIGEQLKAAKATHAEASKAATLAKKADEAADKVVVKADKKGESVPVTQARARLTAAKKEYNAAARQLAEAKIALADAVSAKAKPSDIKTLKLRVEAAAALEKAKGAVVESANNLLSKTLAGEAKATPVTPTVVAPDAGEVGFSSDAFMEHVNKRVIFDVKSVAEAFKTNEKIAQKMVDDMVSRGVITPDAAEPGFYRRVKPVTPTDATSAPLPAAHGTPMGGVVPAVKASPDAPPKTLDASTPSVEATVKMPVEVEEVDDAVDASRVAGAEAAPDAVKAADVTKADAPAETTSLPTGAQKLPRGAVTFAEDGRAIIHAFEGANVETVMHEIGHIMRRDLDADEVDDVVTWMRAQTGDNSLDIVDGRMVSDSGADAIVNAEEVFAEGFVGYLRTGIAPTNNLQRAFDYMKTWLREIYKAVRGFFPTSVSKETGAMFEKLLSVEKSEEAMRKAMASGIDPKATPNIIKRVYKELIGPTLPQAPKTMDELAKAARASGLDVDAAMLDDMMKRHGKIDFPHPVAGKATYTDEDLRRFQATVERARGAAREETRLKQALSGAHEAIVEETPTEALRNRVAGDRMGSALARAATATFIGLDADFDLRALPTNIRAYIKVGARNVEAAYADGVKLLQERSPEKFRAWLTGRPTKFHNGRNAISSGYDYAGAVRSNLQLAFSTLTDEARAGAKVAMASAEKGAPAFIPERLRKANALAVNQTLYASNSDFIKQLGEVLGIPSDGARNDPRPMETVLTGALHRYAHPSPDIDSYAAVDDFLDIIEDTYGPDKAARVGLLIAGHGAGHKAIQKYYNLGVTVNSEEAQVFQSWLHAEKMSDADRSKALRTAEKFGLDPRFVPVSGQFGTIHVPEAARKRLAAAMAKPSQNSLHWLSSPNDIGRGIYKDDVKPGQLAYDGIGFFVRGLKAGMTRGNLLVSSWFNFANTIDRMNQVATKAGFGAAMATMTRVLAQDMLIFTPLVSRAADVGRRFGVFAADAIEAMRRVLSEGGDRMAVAVQKMALANSCSISTNKVLDGVDETVNLGGRWYNYKDLRQVYIDQGVASSYAGELENSIRKSIRPPEGLVEKLGDRLASYMEYVEEMHEGLAERERVGAMLTFIEMGASPEDAAKLAVAALFDYGSSIAPAERSAFLALFFPFWAFQKNANMFTINSLLTPWGAYRVGVIRRTWEGSTEALSELIYGSVADPYGVDTEALGDVGRANYYALRAEIEAFYGGSERVPDDVVLALRHLFGQLPAYMMKDGKIQQLSEKLQNVVTLTSGSDRRTDPLTAHNAMLEIGEAYVPKPDPSKRAGYNRDRPTIAVTFPKTENMKRYLSLAGDDHPYVELMLPEQTIVAGLRHTLNLLAATVLLPQKLIAWADGAYTDDGVEKMWHGMDETYIAGPLTQVMDPDRSILLPEIAADFFGGEDPPPYRIAPVIGELMADLGLPLVKTDAVTDPFALGTDASPEAVAENARLMGNPTWTGRPSSDKNVGVVSTPRYYVPGGVWATLCRRLSGFHDINKLLMSADESTLEGAAGLRGDLIVAASIALGIQEAESTGVKTAAREEPRKPDDALNPNK